ncbi:MAG: proprotein convertase P-domain-containing protein [Phaeodactylibacter sp.]|nr:proprotein convertase P-domain-containing protein [Phaeodactylibacter sp.]
MPTPTIPTSYPLVRGGRQIAIAKIPDEFTIRTAPAVDNQALSRAFNCEVREKMGQQQLSLLSVPASYLDSAMERLRAQSEVTFASHVYALEQDPVARIYLTDEITLEFLEHTPQESIEAMMEEHGLGYVRQITGPARSYVFRLTSQAQANPLKLAYELHQRAEVANCEANVAIRAQHFYTPSDPLFREQWHLYNNGGLQLSQGSHVDATHAWDITRGSRSVVVAIADDSVDLRHRDFSGTGKIVAPCDFQGADFNPAPELDTDNHGTACAGVAVAEENGEGVVGAAPGCALMPIRTSGIIDDNSIEAVFDWAASKGAAVISNSWGASGINFPLSTRQRLALEKAATQGRNGKGCVICFAAGNANRPISGMVEERGWPGGMLEGPTFWYNGFAAVPFVIAVAACTSLNKKSAYSNWGEAVSVCAPSNNGHPGIGDTYTYPRIGSSFPGRGIYTTDRVGPAGYDSSDFTANFGGTSSACPLVAGVAALVISANPELTASEVKEILESTADKIIDTDTDPQLGNTFGAYDENGHSMWFGYGKVNAFAAVAEARRRLGTGTNEPRTFNGQSTPGMSIPDNDYQGVSDAIQVGEQGILSAAEVQVQISHSYIGDLRVSLVTPSGKAAALHDKEGGGKDNLSRTYSTADTPALSALSGEFTEGNWTLLVQDLAPRDTGRLEAWALKLQFTPANLLKLQEQPGITIPDNQPEGIRRDLDTTAEGLVKKARLSVDISHTFISDLQVILRSPAGTEILLHNRTGGDSDNLVRTYDMSNTPALAQLVGQSVKGTWSLLARDLANRDIGKLNAWELLLETAPS